MDYRTVSVLHKVIIESSASLRAREATD